MERVEYKHKKRECWENFKFARRLLNTDNKIFDFIFDRAYALGKQTVTITQEDVNKAAREYLLTRQQARHNAKKEEDATLRDFDKTIKAWDAFDMEQAYEDGANFAIGKQEKDAEGEDSEELLTARRKVIQEAYAANKRIKKEYPRGIMYKQSDAVNGFLWGLFGSKCLPDEEPKPAEPKFKVGDKVRIVDDCHGQKYRGDVTEVVYVDESDPDATYKVDIYDEECGGGLWYSESDLEPYTEPKEREENAQERATLTDDCQSQCKSHHIGDANDMIDDIIKNSFREHNRLHIAAQIVAAIYANYQAAKGFKSIEELVCKALDITDTLIKESEKGGAK